MCPRLTRHARTRSSQRALSPIAICSALDFGREWRNCRGGTIHYIGDRDVAAAARLGIDIRRHRGVTVILSKRGDVVTLYRNRRAPRRQGRRS